VKATDDEGARNKCWTGTDRDQPPSGYQRRQLQGPALDGRAAARRAHPAAILRLLTAPTISFADAPASTHLRSCRNSARTLSTISGRERTSYNSVTRPFATPTQLSASPVIAMMFAPGGAARPINLHTSDFDIVRVSCDRGQPSTEAFIGNEAHGRLCGPRTI
jgi:hypothetical protein